MYTSLTFQTQIQKFINQNPVVGGQGTAEEKKAIFNDVMQNARRIEQSGEAVNYSDLANMVVSNMIAKYEIPAKLNVENNFSGNVITGATFKGNYTKHFDGGAITSGQNVSLTNGNFQTFNIGADLTLTLADWATQTNVLQSLVVSVVSDGSTRALTWAASGGSIKAKVKLDFLSNSLTNNCTSLLFSAKTLEAILISLNIQYPLNIDIDPLLI